MRAEIISIGDELLIGQVINTNAAYLSKKLGEIGVGVSRVTTVGDTEAEILLAFKRAWSEADVVIVTGGLGPTHDDISKAAVAKFFKKKLSLDNKTLKSVEQRFARRGYKKMPIANVGQAMVPVGFKVLRNNMGTAPGLLYQKQKKSFVILPGVPREMKWIVEDSLLKTLRAVKSAGKREVIRHRILMVYGIGESSLSELIGDISLVLEENATLAFLPNVPIVRLRISVHGNSESAVAAKIARIEARLRKKAGKYIYGVDDHPFETVVVGLLKRKHVSIATAESCTGGMLSARLTNVSGAGKVFAGGVVSYSPAAKRSMLGVSAVTLKRHTPVSEQTATEMAEGARKKFATDLAVSITGIAGPDGGTKRNPVGTVWIGIAQKENKPIAQKFHFSGERDSVRERSVFAALAMIRERLLLL